MFVFQSYLFILMFILFFFFNDTATTEIYTLSLHDALPIYLHKFQLGSTYPDYDPNAYKLYQDHFWDPDTNHNFSKDKDRKSTRLNSSHANISYAVFCLKKKNPDQL